MFYCISPPQIKSHKPINTVPGTENSYSNCVQFSNEWFIERKALKYYDFGKAKNNTKNNLLPENMKQMFIVAMKRVYDFRQLFVYITAKSRLEQNYGTP